MTEGRGRGRPSTGVRVDIRIPADVLAEIDHLAERLEIKRPEMIRRLLRNGLKIRS